LGRPGSSSTAEPKSSAQHRNRQRTKLTTLTIHDIGVARQIGRYSDSVEVSGNVRWLYTSGTPGLGLDGTLPSDIAGQAEIAWQHIVNMLAKAGMTAHDLVKMTHYLLRQEDIPAYVQVAPASSAMPGRRRCCWWYRNWSNRNICLKSKRLLRSS
jgi:enamine deaminase RidA (YjgF/YER057c/UK114 family)